jgi:Cell Wall Hydrolase
MGITRYPPVTSPELLAGVIQGEAATPEGQFAVASVIYNRLQSGSFGSSLASVVTPSQFNGFSSNPSTNAQSLANDLFAGNAPSGGTTGNALFYTASNFSTNPAAPNYVNPTMVGVAANGVPIGGNSFSDVQGAPTAGFIAPALGGQTVVPSTINPPTSDDAFSGMTDTDTGGDSLGVSTAPPADDYTSTYTNPDTAFADTSGAETTDQGGSIAGGGIGSDAVAGGAGTADASAFGANETGVVGGANAPASSATSASATSSSSGAGGATNSGSGTPVDITDVTSAGSIAGNAVGTGLNSVGSSVNSSTASIESTGTGWLNSIYTATGNLFVRGGFVLLGIVVLFGAFLFFYKEQGGKFSDLVPRA